MSRTDRAVRRIDNLTPEQEARFEEWGDKWIEIGLRTGAADRERFEAACAECYRYAGLTWHGNVVWVPSPLVVAFSGPIAAHLVHGAVHETVHEAVHGAVREAVHGAVHGAVDGAVHGAVGGAVHGAVGGAVDGAVGGAVGGAVHGAVGEAVGEAVHGAVRETVDGAVRGAVHGAVRGAVGGAVDGAVGEAVREIDGAVHGAVGETVHARWYAYLGGQLWVGGWYWGGAWTSFFREVCGLKLKGNLWDRARAYESTMESACWWWPHRDFVIASERPQEIHCEQIAPRGWGSHQLHRDDGPALAFEGWELFYVHGVRVTEQIVMRPETLTVPEIIAEPNAEVRRIMVERFGHERYLRKSGATLVAQDDIGKLWRSELSDDEPLVMVELDDPSTGRTFWLRTPPDMLTPRQAAAWTFEMDEREYLLAAES